MYEIGGLALQWFKDYLRKRVVQVLVWNSVAEAVSIPFSVIQGSHDEPVLYKMYFYTLGKLTQGYIVNFLGYADDKTLYHIFSLNIIGDEVIKRSNLENSLSRITEWTHENKPKIKND